MDSSAAIINNEEDDDRFLFESQSVDEKSLQEALLPHKSSTKYKKEWVNLMKFLGYADLQHIYKPTESDLLRYFMHLKNEENFAYSSMVS